MDRIIADNSVPFAGRDIAPITGTPQYATSGNPATNTPATTFPAYAWNAIQEEILAVITAAGIAFDRANNAQLLAAIRVVAGSAPAQALVDGATINTVATAGELFKVTLGGNRTLANPSALTDGKRLTFQIKQDGTGSRTLAYGNKFKFPGGVAPVLSTAAGSIDILTCYYEAGEDKIFAVLNQAFG